AYDSFLRRHRDYERAAPLLAIKIFSRFPHTAVPPQFLDLQFLCQVALDLGCMNAHDPIAGLKGRILEIGLSSPALKLQIPRLLVQGGQEITAGRIRTRSSRKRYRNERCKHEEPHDGDKTTDVHGYLGTNRPRG